MASGGAHKRKLAYMAERNVALREARGCGGPAREMVGGCA
jgi:hypothetical protein